MTVILLIAMGLRVWGITFGLPYLFHDDEGFEVIRALQLGSGEFDFERIGKGGYYILLFVEFGFLFVFLKIAGVVESTRDFALYFVRDPSAFYIVGRLTTAAIGTATVYAVYRLGRLAYSERAGLYGAAILAVGVLHANLSHFISVDVPMVFLATVSLFFAIRLLVNGNDRDYLWAATFAALASATKVTAVLLVVPLLCVHFFVNGKRAGGAKGFFSSTQLWKAICVFLAIYLVLTPGMVVSFTTWLPAMLGKFVNDAGSASGDLAGGASSVRDSPYLFAYYLSKLREGMGLPVFVVGLIGLGYSAFRRRHADVVLVSFVLTVYLVMSVATDSNVFFPRYILPVMPVLAILAGRVLSEIPDGRKPGRSPMVPWVLLIALCISPAYTIAARNILITQPDTRALGKGWVDANVPAGSRVFIEGSRTQPSKSTIPLQNSPDNIRESIRYFRESEPGKARYFELELEVLGGNSYDLELVRNENLQSIQYYKDTGVEYLVLRPDVLAGIRFDDNWHKFIAEVRNDPDVVMVKRFSPDPKSVPGPLIEIYRVQPGFNEE